MNMQNNSNKDKPQHIYITLDQSFYYAGDLVTGAVYLKITHLQISQYLYLKLTSNQQVMWSYTSGDNDLSKVDKVQTYRTQIQLARYSQDIDVGQYCYPFSILLPSSLPACLHIDDHNFIRNSLQACLSSFDGKVQFQSEKTSLNLRQPLRQQQQKRYQHQMVGYTSCICNFYQCFNHREVGQYLFDLQKRVIYDRQTIKVKGVVDNTKGKNNINNLKFMLTSKLTKRAQNTTKTQKYQIQVLSDLNMSVNSGQKKQFSTDLTIKSKQIQHTAIGYMLFRTYYIELIGEIGCFYDNIKLPKSILLVNQSKSKINKTNPEIIQKVSKLKPIIYDRVRAVNLRPYLYKPFAAPIIKHNQQYEMPIFNSNRHVSMNSLQELKKECI